jgi:hypothetical protein
VFQVLNNVEKMNVVETGNRFKSEAERVRVGCGRVGYG